MLFADFNPWPIYVVFYGGSGVAAVFMSAAVVFLGLRVARWLRGKPPSKKQ